MHTHCYATVFPPFNLIGKVRALLQHFINVTAAVQLNSDSNAAQLDTNFYLDYFISLHLN